MPQDATCPKCTHAFPVTEARHAFTVACPKCEAELTAEFKKPTTPPEAGQAPYDLLVKPGALPGTVVPPPVPKKKKDEDDEDEPKRKGGSAMIVLVSGGLGLLFVLGGLSLTGWYLFTQIDIESTSSSSSSSGGSKSNPKGNPKGNPDPTPKSKVDTFDLHPIGAPLPPITPLLLAGDTASVDLIGRAGAVAIGGGGRYILMHFPNEGQLGLFDATTGRPPTYVAADNGNVMLAAGAARAVIYVPGANIMRVYALPSLQKMYDCSAPVNGMKSIAMGSRTNGPMLGIGSHGAPHLMDVTAGGVQEIMEARKDGLDLHSNMLRAAPDGTRFSTFDGFRSQKTTILTTEGRRWKSYSDVGEVPFIGTDGMFYGNGQVANERGQTQFSAGAGPGGNTWLVPATSGNGYFLKVVPTVGGGGVKAKKSITVTVHANRSPEVPANGTAPFYAPPEFDNLIGNNNYPNVPYDQHLFLVPEAQVLVTLPANKDRLVLRKVNVR
jgi:hypothetical protein